MPLVPEILLVPFVPFSAAKDTVHCEKVPLPTLIEGVNTIIPVPAL